MRPSTRCCPSLKSGYNDINVVTVRSHFVIHPGSSYTVLYTVKKDLLYVISVTRASRHLTSWGDIILLFIAIGRLYSVINAVSTLKPENYLQITKWFTAKSDPLNAVSARRASRDFRCQGTRKNSHRTWTIFQMLPVWKCFHDSEEFKTTHSYTQWRNTIQMYIVWKGF